MMPIAEQVAMATAVQNHGNMMEASISSATMLPPMIKIPKAPPTSQRKTASNKNCLRISFFRAPIDFRRPISSVRYVTLTSIIFITPTPATAKATALIIRPPLPIIEEILSNISFIASLEVISKLFGSSGIKPRTTRS
jgi:hypothetical protein